jgi:hypothetical protein
MKLHLPLEEGGRYRTNHPEGEDITLTRRHRDDTSLFSEELGLYFAPSDGKAHGTPFFVVEKLPDRQLTLPPVVGRKYLYRNAKSKEVLVCTIEYEDECEGETVYKSSSENDNWTFWPDGEAKLNNGRPPVAVLVEDIPPDTLQELRAQRDAIMKRLREIGAW